jgi:hypothetical protein
MSVAHTCVAQRRRLEALGLHTATLPALRDVDTIDDAEAVARACPAGAFGTAFRELLPALALSA